MRGGRGVLTVLGAENVIRRLDQLSKDAQQGVRKSLLTSVVQLDAYAKQKIQRGGRSGRVYRRRTVTHQASAPGEFPKTDRGQLVASLFFGIDGLVATFGTRLIYGKYLEYGTTRMLPRPWLRPTFKANYRDIAARVKAAVEEALK